MDVLSLSPLPVGAVAWRFAEGRWMLTFVAKATFTLAPGLCALASTQDPIRAREEHADGDPSASVHAPADLVPYKPLADVLLVGSAFARGGRPARSIQARLCVAGVDKTLEVFGRRVWTRDDRLREIGQVTRAPLRYERAAGGLDTWNPVGAPSDAAPDAYGQRPAPGLQPPGLPVKRRGDIVPPVGFGPIAASWVIRREKLPAKLADWKGQDLAEVVFDDDFDSTYFQAAPGDQQVEALRDDEAIVLEGLHQDHARLETALPGLRPRAFAEAPDGAGIALSMRADTLWIDADRGIVTLTWRGQIPIAAPDQPGRVLIALEDPGQELSWAEVAARAPASSAMGGERPDDDGGTTLHLPEDVRRRFEAGRQKTLVMEAAAPRRQMTTTFAGPAPARVPAWIAQPGEASIITPAPDARASPAPPGPVARRGPSGPQKTVTMVAPVGLTDATPAWLVAPSPPGTSPPSLSPEGAAYTAELEAKMAQAAAPPRPAPPPAPAPDKAPVWLPPREPRPKPEPEALWVDLVWHDPAYVPSIYKNEDWAAIMDKARPPPPAKDKSAKAPKDAGEAPKDAGADGKQTIVRTALLGVLSKAAPMGRPALREALAATFGGESAALPPLVLLAGELELSFDELAALKVVSGLAAPVAASDKKLKEMLAAADEILKSPFQPPPDVLQGLVQKVMAAWSAANRLMPAGYLEAQSERHLLEQRLYRKRELLDETWIRATLTAEDLGPPLPTYLPASLARRLPLFRRFPARVLGEALPRQDQYEQNPIALRAVALGRVLDGLDGAL